MLADVEAKSGKKFGKIILECSPFIRVMETCAFTARALGIETVNINYKVAEHQSEVCFPEGPVMEKIEFKTRSFEDLNSEYKLLDVKF